MTSEFFIAIYVMVYLNHEKKPVSWDALFENVWPDPTEMTKILRRLKKAELIESSSTPEEAYTFTRDPSAVTFYDIFKATDKNFVKIPWRFGHRNRNLSIPRKMAPVMDDTLCALQDAGNQVLKGLTLSAIDGRAFPLTPDSENPD